MAGIGRFWQRPTDERAPSRPPRAIEGMARLGGQALGERGHPGLGVPERKAFVGGGRALLRRPAVRGLGTGAGPRRPGASRSSHLVATWSRGLVSSGRPRPQERMKA